MKNLKKQYKDYQWGYELYYPKKKSNYAKFIRDLFKEWISRKTCQYFGHKWYYESQVGPESGSESIHCDRCGYNEDITYY